MSTRILAVLALVLCLGGCQTQGGVYHTVREGQTLYRIGRTYGVDEAYLARINGVGDPTRLRSGERLFIPGATRVLEVPAVSLPPSPPPAATAARPPAPPARAATGAAKPPAPPAKPAAAPRPPAAARASTSPAPVPAPAPAPAAGKFIWPLKGEILTGFGQSRGLPCQGLEIAAARGTPVLSAAAGRVIYSGDGIGGYGNLIILKHDDAFFTVYGYNERNLVSAGSFVSKGEKIARSGIPPSGGAPRLYFEIRHGKNPVNPIFYLP